MAYAILHTDTRVIRRVTKDPAHVIESDETKVDVGAQVIDLAPGASRTGFWKLTTQNEQVEADAQEVDDADVDPVRTRAKLQALQTARLDARTAIIDAASNVSLADFVVLVQDFFRADRDLDQSRPRR